MLLCHSEALFGHENTDSTDFFIIRKVQILGNNWTAKSTIFKELDLTPGDTIRLSNFSTRKDFNIKRLYSTALFTNVSIEIKNWSTTLKKADIIISVQENWYIYPSIIFELADRNFNDWWTNQNRDFNRVNYGLGLDHINLTGKRDKLKLKLQGGYTKKYEIKYNYPLLTNNWGIFGEVFYSDQKEIGYITKENKTLFYKHDDERILLKRFRTGIGANYRPDQYHFHDFKLEYHHNQIDSFVANELNPDYFLGAKTGIRFFSLKYDFTYDKRGFNFYPEQGYMIFANITKEGLGIFDDFDNLSIFLGFEKYIKISNHLVYGGRIKAKTNLTRQKIDFANNTGLGYGIDFVRGYELYVMDGTDWILAKTSLRYKAVDTHYILGRYMPIKAFKKMNFQLFFRFNLDAGYVNEQTYTATNNLNNKPLVGFGPALDILLFHTYKMSFEYTFNHRFENGLYLNWRFNF